MSIIKGKHGLSLNVQHDYITLRTPNGNYTSSWGGARASGKLAQSKNGFNNIDKYVETIKKEKVLIDVMKDLIKTEIISTLWSGWNEEIKKNDFASGNNVKFNNSLLAKKYPNGGVVKNVARKYVYVHLVDGDSVCGFDYNTLEKV